jgi:Phosphotransferase enzyme family
VVWNDGRVMRGEFLHGNVGGAWRVGNTVHRDTGPWTAAVHALLGYLHPRLPHVPEVLGTDEQGREVLSFMPGRVVDIDHETLSTAQVFAVARWTRRFHQAVAGFSHPGPWRFAGAASPSLICHNDIAPYNACFDGDDLVGVFDWDLAGPSTPLLELAFIAWNCVPLWRDVGAATAADRLKIIADGYGGPYSAHEIAMAVPDRIQLMIDWIPGAAAGGDDGIVRLMAGGEPQRSIASLAGLRARLPDIARLL